MCACIEPSVGEWELVCKATGERRGTHRIGKQSTPLANVFWRADAPGERYRYSRPLQASMSLSNDVESRLDVQVFRTSPPPSPSRALAHRERPAAFRLPEFIKHKY